MKKRVLYIITTIVTILSISSCKNDLDILAPGSESVSVYGILNPSEAVQNIRINKVYLTSGDAVAAGQDASQINYGPGELEVTLERYLDGVQMNVNTLNGVITSSSPITDKRIVLTETVVTTANGNFNPNQRIWQTNSKIFVVPPSAANSNPKTEYKLNIKIIKSGTEITATTAVVDSVKSYSSMPFVYYPSSNASIAYPTHCNGYVLDSPPGTGTKQGAYIDYSNLNLTPRIKFKSIPNAKLYEVVMRFHYIDSLTTDNLRHDEYVDYNFSTQKSSTLVGGEEMYVEFSANDFYTNLAAEISKKQTANIRTRTSNYIEYIIYAGEESLNTFLQVNQPSTTIAQDKPNYTNINGGVGIFSSRSRSVISKNLWYLFINQIADHPSTQGLLFNKHNSFICP